MKHDLRNRTFDCAPTLNDFQVLEFCRTGFLILPGVVDSETNQKTLDYLEGRMPINPTYIPDGITKRELEKMSLSNEPSSIILEDWFAKNVLMNPEVAGALRSLLGNNVGLPVLMSKHSVETPSPGQNWHHDADAVFGPEINYLEAFYFPQDTPAELGPTEIVSGSHIDPSKLDNGEPGIFASGPAGTVVIHHQSILHRRGRSTTKGFRHMLKYNYWRTSPPKNDWIHDATFDPRAADYGGHEVARYIAHIFYWLSGKGEDFRTIGGQAWPHQNPSQIGPSYGFESAGGYLPDWRKNNKDGYSR